MVRPTFYSLALPRLYSDRPGDNPNQCAQGYSCPPPSMSFDSFVPVGNRYIDVSAGGPNPFTWTATSSAPWLKLSTTKGSISPQNPEQRVFVSVDWSQVSGSQTATIRFTAVAAKQPNLVQTVSFTAVHNTVPSDFRGESPSLGSFFPPVLTLIVLKDSSRVMAAFRSRLLTHQETLLFLASRGPNSLILVELCRA